MYQVSIKAARVNAGMNRRQVAEALGVTERTVFNWEQQRTAIPIDMFKRMCDLYSVPIQLVKL